MAQNIIGIKILSKSVVSGLVGRGLHTSVSNLKCLHNTASTSHVVDSMSRVHAKLYGPTEWDKNPGVRSRVGPTQAVLETVGGNNSRKTSIGGEALSSSAASSSSSSPSSNEKSNRMVMEDPNGTMWQLYKDKKTSGVNLKKMKQRISSMKQNIKEYYVNRLNQDETTFAETEETFKIGKITSEKKGAAAERRRMMMMREEQLEREMENEREIEFEAEAPPLPPRKTNIVKRKSLFTKLQEKEERGGNKEESSKDEGSDQLSVGQGLFRNYNQESRRKLDKEERNEEQSKKSNSSALLGEEQAKSPLFNFKWDSRCTRASDKLHLSGSIFQKRALEGRKFSTMATPYKLKMGQTERANVNDNLTRSIHSKYEPIPLMLQRHITTNANCLKSKLSDGLVKDRALSTCSKYYDLADDCMPKPLPPKQGLCGDDKQFRLPKCPKKPCYEWGPCCKITLCGCLPPSDRIQESCWREPRAKLSCGKKPEYKCPAFSECTRIVEIKKRINCCEIKKPCKSKVGMRKPFIFAIERMEDSLGQKYWTGNRCRPRRCLSSLASGQRLGQNSAGGINQFEIGTKRGFASLSSLTPLPPMPLQHQQQSPLLQPQQLLTTPTTMNVGGQITVRGFKSSSLLLNDKDKSGGGGSGENEEECKAEKKGLPCLKAVKILGVKRKPPYKGKATCEKICLPCCQPARDPPECLSPYVKPPCTKFRNPRPSYSECRKMFPMKHYKCECEIPKKPICDDNKKKDGGTDCSTC